MTILDEGTQCTVDMGDGIVIPFSKIWGSFHFTGDPYGTITVLRDEWHNKRYEGLTSEVIGDSGTVGDMDAVRAYLSTFVG